jgi:hypothetical protein
MQGPPPDGRLDFSIATRPERLVLEYDSAATGANHFRARVLDVLYAGVQREVTLAAQEVSLRALLLNKEFAIPPGENAMIYIPPEAVIPLED